MQYINKVNISIVRSRGGVLCQLASSKWLIFLQFVTIFMSCFIGAQTSLPSLSLNAINVNSLSKMFSPFYNIYPDAYLDPPKFISSRHFVPETHQVLTKDNYWITIHRVINPLVPRDLRHRLKPVILQHGLITSSFNFLISSDRNNDRPRFDKRDLTRTHELNPYRTSSYFSWHRIAEAINDLFFAKLGLSQSTDYQQGAHISQSLAFELANQGYDVWMPNSRGSTYSLNHTHLDWRRDVKYWDFSFHEMAIYDLPAVLEYVLSQRPERKSLSYVGHSQGNLMMFILQSYHPEWSAKVKPFVAMAPIAFIPDVYFGAARVTISGIRQFTSTTALNRAFKGQIFPKSQSTAGVFDTICVPKASEPLCDLLLAISLGDNFKRANHSLTPVIAHHIPEGTSILNFLHFGYLIETGQFRSFDFGPIENLRRYGNRVNPLYPIGRINSPDIAFVKGATDTLSTQRNVAITKSMLRVPLMDEYTVPDLVWGHSDYMYANGAGRLANAHIIGLCDRYRLID